jgi:tRNA1Val (adenine37-N6)-methyltransferase
LILAQFFENAQVTALEIDREAVQEAKDNVAKSKFAGRIEVVHQSLQNFTGPTGCKFDFIVSNPPYFVRSFLPPEKARRMARHSKQLPFRELIQGVEQLLHARGLFALILPFNVSQSFAIEAAAHGLHLVRLTGVRDTAKHAAIRHLMLFSKQQWLLEKNVLSLYNEGHEERSVAFHELTKDLYLQS